MADAFFIGIAADEIQLLGAAASRQAGRLSASQEKGEVKCESQKAT